MMKLTTSLSVLMFTQLSFGATAFKCECYDKSTQLEITHNRVAEVLLKKNGAAKLLMGSVFVNSDSQFKIHTYELIDQSGEKADLAVSTKTYVNNGGICRTRACVSVPFSLEKTTAKLNYQAKEVYFTCQ